MNTTTASTPLAICPRTLQAAARRAGVAGLWLLLVFILLNASRAADAPRWNILFVFADDWGRYASCYKGLDGRPSMTWTAIS